MSTDTVITLASTILTAAVAIYAICDVRNEAKKMVKLGRDLAYQKIINDMIWEFIEPTERAHTREVAKGLHEFGLLAQTLNPEWTPEAIKAAVGSEALEFAEELVKSGRATWKGELNLEKVRKAIDTWRIEKNAEKLKKIMGETRTRRWT